MLWPEKTRTLCGPSHVDTHGCNLALLAVAARRPSELVRDPGGETARQHVGQRQEPEHVQEHRHGALPIRAFVGLCP